GGGRGNGPSNHTSYVTDVNGVMTDDIEYASDLVLSRAGSIDVVMNQCFGGGFLNEIESNRRLPAVTFASSAAYNQVSRSVEKLDLSGAFPDYLVDNFTRAWRENAMRPRDVGMRDDFSVATFARYANRGG